MLVTLTELMTAIIEHQPMDWVRLSQGLIVVPAIVLPLAIPALMIPSALGWWVGGVLLKQVDAPL